MNQELKQEYQQTELGELPVDWNIEKFEDCLSHQKIKISKIQQLQFIKIGKYPIVDQSQELISGYWNNDDDVFASPLPVIIFGDHTRTLKFIDFPFVCGPDGTKILIPDKTKIHPRFFYYYLQLLNIPSKGYNRHYSLLKEKFIARPPLPEQQKIAYVLSTIQEGKEKTENTINSYKELKKSLMKHLFKYGPVKFEDADKVKLKETEIGEIPEGWGVVKLGDTVKTYSGGTPHREKEEYYNGNIGWLKSGELNDKRVYASEEYITTEGLNNSSAKYVEDGTLLLALYGATAGKVGLSKAKLTINQAICAIVPNEKFFSEFYFYYFMTIRDKLLAERFGGAQPNLNQQIIKNLLIPLPSLPIQQEIAEILSSVDSKIEQEENKKKALEELFKSMLSNLMSAKIRVKEIEVKNRENTANLPQLGERG